MQSYPYSIYGNNNEEVIKTLQTTAQMAPFILSVSDLTPDVLTTNHRLYTRNI